MSYLILQLLLIPFFLPLWLCLLSLILLQQSPVAYVSLSLMMLGCACCAMVDASFILHFNCGFVFVF